MQEKATNQNALSPKQQEAVAALMSCKTITAAAALVGVDDSTIYRWLKEPAFKQALREAEGQAIEAVVSRLAGAAGQAVDVLVELMGGTKVRTVIQARAASVRLRAAQVILEQTIRLRELAQHEERLLEIEELLRRNGGNTNYE